MLKEEFRIISEKLTDRGRAEVFLQRWIWKAKAIENWYLSKFVSTLQNWWQEFLNHFVEGVTNGFVEGINRVIRATIRRACGYRVFENFRLQVIAEFG